MGWTKNRERLHEAAVSTVKAISKNKKITSNTGLSQRPPVANHIVVPAVPRSSKDINKWRGESDFQAFWYLFHKNTKDIQLTLPARMIFNELEISRVELLGCNQFIGSIKNISNYLDAKSKDFEEEKSLNFISYGANLWLKNAANFEIDETSKYILNKFVEKYNIDNSLDDIKENLINSIENQKEFEKYSLKFLKGLELVKEDLNEEEEIDYENAPGTSDDIENKNEQAEENFGEDENPNLKDLNTDDEIDIQDALESVDDTSIDEEIDSLTYPNNEFRSPNKKDYSIYTTNFDEVIEAKDLVTNDESLRLRNQLDNLIKPHISTIGKLANRLQRLLLAKQNTSWNFNLEEGILDNSRLHRIVTTSKQSPCLIFVFVQTFGLIISPFNSTTTN